MAVACWLLIAIQLQIVDGILTYIGLSKGYEEGNPVVAYAIHTWGWTGLVAAKVLSCAFLLAAARHGLALPILIGSSVLIFLVAVLPWTIILLR